MANCISSSMDNTARIATGLPVDTPLWGAADVWGKCTKIKSEILSGKSGGVDYVCIGEHEAVSCTYEKGELIVMKST